MRLIHLADYGGPYAGSFIPMLRSVGELAQRRGWPVTFVFSEIARDRVWLAELEGKAVHFASPGGVGRLLAEMDAEAGPTILHSHFSSFDVEVAAYARTHAETFAFWHVHSALENTWRARIRNTVRFSLLARGVERIFCVSPNIYADVRNRLGRKAMLFPNAIDTSRFTVASPEERLLARQTLGLPPDDSVVLHFGRDWLLKGGDVFVEAIAKTTPPVLGVTVGAGPEAFDEADRLGIRSRIRVLPPSNDVTRLYHAADVFVSTSRREGMPFCAMEAMSSGLPTVLSDIPGQRALAGAPGCAVTDLDAAAIAKAVEAARETEPPGAESHRWIRQEADIAAWAARLLELYEAAALRLPR